MTRQSEYTKMRQNRYAKRLLKKRGVGLNKGEKDYKIALDAKETEVEEARVKVAQAEKETDISKKMTDRILEMARERLERVEGGLKKKDRVNFYHASTWSFLHTVLQLCLQQQQQEEDSSNPAFLEMIANGAFAQPASVTTREAQREMTAYVGTPVYMAPEIMTTTSERSKVALYGEKADVYSLGMMMWSLWARERPFSDDTHKNMVRGGVTRAA